MKKRIKRFLSRIAFLSCILIIWEIISRIRIFPELLFPPGRVIFDELVKGFTQHELLEKTFNSLTVIFEGMLLGIIVALFLVGLSQINFLFNSIVENLILFLNPIPSVAIFPLCILWFGIGKNAVLFIMVHSVLWAVLINIMAGIKSIPEIYKDVGLNLELNKFNMVKEIYIPACMPFIISGLRMSFARAWRTAIAAELMAGVISSSMGLGGYMTFNRNTLNIPGLYATIIIIITIGIIFEDVLFRFIEKRTIVKWGMIK
jgi:NitT/TauT family transport system permease protein